MRKDRDAGALEVVETADVSVVPAQLRESGIALWNHIAQYCRIWLAPSDIPTVVLLCEAMDTRADLKMTVEREGILLRGKERDYINPALRQLTDVEAAITKWMSQLGLNPSDRGRLGLTQVRAKSKLEEMRERAAARRSA